MPKLTFFFSDSFPDPALREQYLVLEASGQASKDWLLGRGPEATVKLNARTISRKHALIHYTSATDRWSIEDLASTGGTWLNSFALKAGDPAPLLIGDRLWVGEPAATISVVENEQDTLNTIFVADVAELPAPRTYADILYLIADWLVSAKSTQGKVYRICFAILLTALTLALIIALG